MKPSNFKKYPWASVFKCCESEIVALNIMTILSRKGDEWKNISWDEYKEERLKDKNFSEHEKEHFDKVKDYCISEDTARLFSREWR